MKACGGAGEWKQALNLFNEMRGIGIPPTELCFTAAIKACAKADEVSRTTHAVIRLSRKSWCDVDQFVCSFGYCHYTKHKALQPHTFADPSHFLERLHDNFHVNPRFNFVLHTKELC